MVNIKYIKVNKLEVLSRKLFRYKHGLFVLIMFLSAFAYNGAMQDYNHPELKWYTFETKHLRVHYTKGVREKAFEIASIGEKVCSIYENKYRIVLPQKTELAVLDSDQPGGWAAPVLNMVSIDVHEFDFRLRGTNDWLKNVVTHELAHIYSIRSALKFPSWIPDIRIGYFDYINERIQTSGFHVISGDIMPQWFVEGIAQFESSTEGSDTWDTNRDMIMRVSVLENKLLTYDEMCVFSGKSINFEKTYNQGFSLVSYINEKYGFNAIVSLCRESAVLHHQSFNPVIKRVLGITSKQLYSDWVKYLKQLYSKQIVQIGHQYYGEKLTRYGFNTAFPRWSSDDKELFFVSNWKRDYGYRSLYKYSFSDSIKDDKKRVSQVLGSVGSVFSLSSDDKRVMFLSSKKRDKNRWPRRDVYIREIKPKKTFFFKDKKEVRVTKELSVLYADLSRDAKFIVAVKKHGASDYLAVVGTNNGKPKYIFPHKSLTSHDSASSVSIYTPRISPDGKNIVFSYFDGKVRQIGLIDTAGKAFYTFFKSGFDDRDPSWSPDGKWIIFSSDRTGVFNLYKKNIKTGDVVQITNVSGGAFYPEMSHDSKQIAYVNYDKDNFSLYVISDTILNAFENKGVLIPVEDEKNPVLDVSASIEKYKYTPSLVLFSPIIVGQEVLSATRSAKSGKPSWLGGGVINMFDPLQKNYFAAMFLLQMNNGFDFVGRSYPNIINPEMDKELNLTYENRMLPFTLPVDFSLRTIHDKDRFWNEDERDTTELIYQISMTNFGISPRYQLTPNQKVHFLGNYFISSTFFTRLAFFPRFKYLEGYRLGLMWTYLSKASNTASNIAPMGLYLKIKLDRWNNELIKDGTLSEALTIENGHIKALTNPSNFYMGTLSAKYGIPNPLYSKHVVGVNFSGTFMTPAKNSRIHSFFQTGPFMKSNPYLKNSDSLYLTGNNCLRLEFDYSLPVFKNINKSYGPLFLDQLYGLGFYEVGTVWNENPKDLEIEKLKDNSIKGVGVELRLESISYNVYPFSVFLRSSYALNDKLKSKERQRWNFGINFSFDNWEFIDIPDYISKGNIR